MTNVTLTTVTALPKLKQQLAALEKKRVLVGIPESKAARDTAGINNAQLMYVQTNGSPARGIPPRPVIEPGITNNLALIEPFLKDAIDADLRGDESATEQALELTGRAGANAVIRWFTDARNGWAENSKRPLGAWLAQKISERIGKPVKATDSYYDVKTKYRGGVARPLIDTGSMRGAITSVVVSE